MSQPCRSRSHYIVANALTAPPTVSRSTAGTLWLYVLVCQRVTRCVILQVSPPCHNQRSELKVFTFLK